MVAQRQPTRSGGQITAADDGSSDGSKLKTRSNRQQTAADGEHHEATVAAAEATGSKQRRMADTTRQP